MTIVHDNSGVELADFEPDLDFELGVLGLVDITSYELVDPSGKPIYFADTGAAKWLAGLARGQCSWLPRWHDRPGP